MIEKAARGDVLELGSDVPEHLWYRHRLELPNGPITKSKMKDRAFDLGHKTSEALFCGFFEDILKTVTRIGYDYKIYPEEQCKTARSTSPAEYYSRENRNNYCLKLYLADDQDSKEMSPFGFVPFKSHNMADSYAGDMTGAKGRKELCISGRSGAGRKRSRKSKKGTVKYEKYTLDILLELYGYFIKHRCYPFEAKLCMLKEFAGTPQKSGWKVTDAAVGFQSSAGRR